MFKTDIKKILREYTTTEEISDVDNIFIEEIEEINNLNDSDPQFENKLDKVWNSIELKAKKNNIDMIKLNLSINDKLKNMVSSLKDKSKNPTVWIRRNLICQQWK